MAQTTKIKHHENLTHEKFLTRKFPDIRYIYLVRKFFSKKAITNRKKFNFCISRIQNGEAIASSSCALSFTGGMEYSSGETSLDELNTTRPPGSCLVDSATLLNAMCDAVEREPTQLPAPAVATESCRLPFCIYVDQWFLTWVRSNPRGSVSQFQGFGGLVHPTRMIRDVTLCLAIVGCS